jgi:hypothetical protein
LSFFITPSEITEEVMKKKTIQRDWQYKVHKTQDRYMLENTEGVIKKDNPEKLAVYLMLPVSLDCPFLLPLRYSLTCICPVSCVSKYMLENTEGVMKKDNPEKLAT